VPAQDNTKGPEPQWFRALQIVAGKGNATDDSLSSPPDAALLRRAQLRLPVTDAPGFVIPRQLVWKVSTDAYRAEAAG
jgi:hypothetical protein